MEKSVLVKRLLSWYEEHKRPLPWREDSDPYKIWLSEIILQQTRVRQGLPYYQRFITAYPTVLDLAKASVEEVLHLWQGLGYYSRARHLHQCSQEIVQRCRGKFPQAYQALLKLPGVGRYTAAAIASIAFGEPVAVVDGNVYRVLSRLFGIEADIASHQGQKMFRELAESLVPQKEAGVYNQALMEFGALHCTPRQPQCDTCPFQRDCVAYQTSRQGMLPTKLRRVQIRDRYFHYLILHSEEHVYVKQRQEKDIWKGLYDFYLIESVKVMDNLYALKDPLISYIKAHKLRITAMSRPIDHQLTHQRLHMQFYHIYTTPEFIKASASVLRTKSMFAQKTEMLPKLPFPRAIHRFFDAEKTVKKYLSSNLSPSKGEISN